MPIVLWVTPHQGKPARLVAGWHTTPGSMSLCPPFRRMVRPSSCQKSPSLGAHSDSTPTACWASGVRGVLALPMHASPLAHPRSPPSQSPWKTQCAQSNQFWLDVSPWNGQASTECGNGVVLILEPPDQGQLWCSAVAGTPRGSPTRIPCALSLATVSLRLRGDCSGWKVLQRQR